VTDLSFRQATISWTTNQPATSLVEYGLTGEFNLSAQTPGTSQTHSVVLPSDTLLPGTDYSYRVVSIDAAGNTVTSADATFRTKGALIEILLTDADGNPLPNAEVTVGGRVQRTDDNGIARFEDIGLGQQAVSAEADGKKTESTISVEDTLDNTAAEPQSFTIQLVSGSNLLKTGTMTALILLLVGGSGLIGRLWWQRHRLNVEVARATMPGYSMPHTEPTVISPGTISKPSAPNASGSNTRPVETPVAQRHSPIVQPSSVVAPQSPQIPVVPSPTPVPSDPTVTAIPVSTPSPAAHEVPMDALAPAPPVTKPAYGKNLEEQNSEHRPGTIISPSEKR